MFNQVFKNNVNMITLEERILDEIKEFQASNKRAWMLTGEKYYNVENDIFDRQIVRHTESGTVTDYSKSNNKLAHGFAKSQVDEKVAYLLSKDYTLDCDNEEYIQKVKDVLGKYFQYTLTTLGTESSNKGIAWLQVYVDGQGKFKMLFRPSEQCIPLWKDNSHTELDALIRFYEITVYEGRQKKKITKVEYYTEQEVVFYVMRDNKLILDIEENKGEPLFHYRKGDEPRSFGKVPFIAFKNNRQEYPDIKYIKSLIDDYDKSRSDISNFIEEVKNLIYVLKGYGGQDLKKFINDLNYYRAIIIDDPQDGGVDTLNPTMDITASKEHYEQLKRDINEFGQSVTKDLDKFGSSPSGIALKFLYSGLDLKCNHLEVEFKRAFEDLLYFVNIYLQDASQGTFGEDVTLVFNRDIKINETETINNCVASKDIISDEAIITHHPWVNDVEEEITKLKQQQTEKAKTAAKEFGSYNFKKVDGQDEE